MSKIKDIEKTSRPDDTYSYTSDETSRPQDNEEITDKTSRPEDDLGNGGDTADNGFEPFYEIEGEKYTCIEPISAGKTGEADVLLVEKEGEKFALKLYKKNYTPNVLIFEKVKKLSKFGFLVPLYSYGTWTKPDGAVKLSYELMKYIPTQSLDKFQLNKDERLLKEIALSAAKCIDFCHKKQILHRDIKPGNFFFTDDTKSALILADFGVSDLLENDGYSYATQSGTNTYNAPEVYLVAEKKVRLTPKADFYSLGVLLMSLWMGEAKFRSQMGDKEGKGRLFDLRERKAKGTLPYPTDLSADLILLIKGLTIPDEKKRWGFEEIIKWAKGEIKQTDISVVVRNDIAFIFDETKGYVAYTPEELAAFMISDREYALKILKRGKVTDWLKKCNRDKMATEIDDIVNTTANNNGCVMRSVFTLDPEKPFAGKRNDACKTLADIGAEVFEMAPDNPLITDPDSDLYAYMTAHHWKNISDKCYEIVRKNHTDPQIEMAYVIDPLRPYFIYDNTLQKKVACNTLEDIVSVLKKRNGNLPDDERRELLSEKFYRWLRARDGNVLDKVQAEMEDSKSPHAVWCLLYNLDLRCSYELTLSADEGACHKTAEDIAHLINEHTVRYYCVNKGKPSSKEDKQSEAFIYYLHDFKGSRLYYYMKSKEVFGKQIDWINYCYDIDSKTNVKKCTVYNEATATWKTIKGLLGKENNPEYYFPKSKKTVNTLNELSTIDKSEIREETDNGFLSEWLSVFFQENPYEDLSKKYTFEKLTDKFLHFMQSIYPKQLAVQRYKTATDEVQGKVSKIKSNVRTLILLKILAGVLFVLPLLALIVSLLVWGLPFNENPLPKFSSVIILMGIVIGILVFIYDNADGFFNSMFTGLFFAALLYYVVYFSLRFLMPYSSWVLIVLLAFLAFFVFKKCYWNLPLYIKSNQDLLSLADDVDAAIVQPLFFAFKSNEPNYRHSYSDELDNYIFYLKNIRKKLLKYFIPSIIIVSILIFLMVKITPALGGKLPVPVKPKIETLNGVWKGYFGDKEAMVNITDSGKYNIKASVSVKFKKWVTEEFSGSYSDKTLQLTLKDNNRYNRIMDGTFLGTVNDSTYTYEGKYRNYSTGKEYDFKFSRDKAIGSSTH